VRFPDTGGGQGWKTSQEAREALEQLTKNEIYELKNDLRGTEHYLHFDSGDTKTMMIQRVIRWYARSPHKDRMQFVDLVNVRLQEKKQYPVRGEAPGTRYIKWDDFTSLPNYPLIARAVSYAHDYRRKCSPITKDGYVSVDAIYNMSAWASWKSSSLSPREAEIASAIHGLRLYDLMVLNRGRRKDQPALFPIAMFPRRK